MSDQMTPDEHRAEAQRLIAIVDEPHRVLTETEAIAAAHVHALLAGPPTTELEPVTLRAPASLGWSGAFVLLVLAATVLGAVWLVTR